MPSKRLNPAHSTSRHSIAEMRRINQLDSVTIYTREKFSSRFCSETWNSLSFRIFYTTPVEVLRWLSCILRIRTDTKLVKSCSSRQKACTPDSSCTAARKVKLNRSRFSFSAPMMLKTFETWHQIGDNHNWGKSETMHVTLNRVSSMYREWFCF